MEEWPTFSNGSSLDCLGGVETVGAFPGNVCCPGKDHVDNGADHGKLKQKYLFYQLFPAYLKDSCSMDGVRPLPVLVDGQQLDLYKLFSLVKERGGYARVSKKGLWGSVTKELGLNPVVCWSVKLVFDKYLNDFERWLKKTFEEKNLKNGNHGCDWGLKLLPLDIEKEFRALLCSNLKDKDDDRLVKSKSIKKKKNADLVNHKNGNNLLDTNDQNNKSKDVQRIEGDNDEKSANGIKGNPATLGAEGAEKEFNPRKRKRDVLFGMLNWMKHIAKHPLDPLTQPIPKPSKWKEYNGQDFFGQFLRAREALSLRQHEEPNSGSSSLQKQKMHPAMYEDHVAFGRPATGKLRCSERLPSFVKSRSCSCCNPCSPNGNRLAGSHNMEAEKCPPEKTTETLDVSTTKTIAEPSGDESLEKQVSVGPRFQAEVPEWTGVVSESDSKWLGTQVWTLKNDTEHATETDIGKGRQEKCSCEFHGSVECVRLHIAENRMKLKLELGSEFYRWGFDRMGEEVSLQWTTEEEKRFKDIMKSNIPSKNKYFWNNPSKYFPKKTRRNLVSYYFNVFLIQLRTYQNRVSPKSVDSDDDEVEFGSFSDGFGMEAVKGPDDDFLECSLNKQCTDFE
ncbi:AT-rich interactive domain-containing protein 2-like [Glycine soja]|uniref:AT-rich interactive domain-containing protein 2 isoform A n=1 Tax=Glycine soja TaxID=3848 RepID=A0A445KSI6_GLYSO|nr:AT-rich interactive domain-containing protein 2-like [Glycine soja]KHM99959.1 AT-rich interactive domain-containing protein 2 [Glycine soja]RZC13562.1 AT-rich interactive domain-containing protein 2 isoform A [Glycine soja]RZC13563.1 AT-rich interactive domain-containing protein 2 isoform B [Glycine soja]